MVMLKLILFKEEHDKNIYKSSISSVGIYDLLLHKQKCKAITKNKILHPKFIKMNRVLLFYHTKCGLDIVNEHQQRQISASNSPQNQKL